MAQFQRLLVVSDNPELTAFLQSLLSESDFAAALQVEYRFTSYNKAPQQMIDLGAKRINIKKDTTVESLLRDFDLIFSLHCKQIFPKRLVENVCCINFHPGLNPWNRGWFPQVFSILNNLPVGATVHLMDSKVDHGHIVAQREVSIQPCDTSLEVYRKVIEVEKELIRENIAAILQGRFETIQPQSEGNYNSLDDFRSLCQLDLKSQGSLQEHLNLLRATTHGDFKNAYFLGEDGKKYFVKIVIEEDGTPAS